MLALTVYFLFIADEAEAVSPVLKPDVDYINIGQEDQSVSIGYAYPLCINCYKFLLCYDLSLLCNCSCLIKLLI